MVRFSSVVALLLALSLSGPALAQVDIPPTDDGPDALEPGAPDPTPLPIPPARAETPAPKDGTKAVDALLGRLAKTEDPAAAKRIAAAVQAMWMRSGSDTVDLLTSRAAEAQRNSKSEIAKKLLDEVVAMKPDYAEGWNRRATVNFLDKNLDEAMADIHETLIREPRHFGAWVGLGRILADTGYDAKALAAYRKALEIYPAIDGLKKEVDELTLKVEGQPI